MFLSAATEGTDGAEGAAEGGSGGGAAPGRGGGPPLGLAGGGGLGVAGAFLELLVSGSESYMFTPPPRDFNLGIPPANKPPNCGAASIPPAAAGCSLLLLALFALSDAPGGFSPPGTGIGGAPAGGALPESFDLSMMGADRSLICVTFFSFAPD